MSTFHWVKMNSMVSLKMLTKIGSVVTLEVPKFLISVYVSVCVTNYSTIFGMLTQ